MSNGTYACDVLNRHMHPRPVENCRERCGMCLGYCCPAGVAVLVFALGFTYIVFFLLVMKDYPNAWRIVVSIVSILLILAMGSLVLWSFYMVVYTSPGYVDREVWQHHPHYRPLLTELEEVRQEQQQRLNGGSLRRSRAGGSVGSLGSDGPPQHQEEMTAGQGHALNRKDSHDRGAVGDHENPLMGPEHRFCGVEDVGTEGVHVDSSHTAQTESCGTDRPAYSTTPSDPHLCRGGGGAEGTREEAEAAVCVRVDAEGGEGPVGTRRRQNSPFGASASAPTPPGPPQPLSGSPLNPYIVSQLDRWGNIRFCKLCDMYKPDLAYHCRVCKRCVYNFDHHCPYINNCVGRNNYKLFVVFLLHSSVACLIAGAVMALGVAFMDKKQILDKIGWAAVPFVMIILGLALGGFHLEHRCLLAKGKSTVESVVAQRVREEQSRERGMNPCSSQRKRYNEAQREKQAAQARPPPPTEEEKIRIEQKKRARKEAHRRALMGDERGWRALMPKPLRLDDSSDGIPHV